MGKISKVIGFVAAAALVAVGFLTGQPYLISLGISIGLSSVAALLAKKPSKITGTQLQTQLGGEIHREILFGHCATKGHLIYENAYGKKNKFLQRVYVLSDWLSEELVAVWVNGEKKTLVSQSIPVGNNEDARYKVDGYDDLIIIRFFKGSEDQLADKELIDNSNPAGRWTVNHRGRGVCYVSVTCEWDDDKFQGGFPDILWELKGAVLYDLRKDGTNGGTGSHRFDTVSTWEYSDNPVVAAYCFLRGFKHNDIPVLGHDASASDFINSRWTSAANVCDETITENSESVKRYTVALIASSENERGDVVDAFTQAIGGFFLESDGFFSIFAGAAQSTIADLTTDDLAIGHDARWASSRSIGEVYNSIHGNFTDPSNAWQPSAYPPLTDAEWVTEDGGDSFDFQFDLMMVSRIFQAARIRQIRMRQIRLQANATIVVGMKHMKLEAGDWITYTNDQGGTRTYRIAELTRVDTDKIQLELEEINTDVYGDEAITIDVPVLTQPDPDDGDTTVSNFAVSDVEQLGDGGQVIPGIRFSWDAPTDPTVDFVLIEYRVLDSPPGPTIPLTDGSPADGGKSVFNGILANTTYEARATIKTNPPRATTWTEWTQVTTSANYVIPDQAFEIPDGSIDSDKLADDAVIAQKLADLSVTAPKIALEAVFAKHLVLTDYSNIFPDAALRDDTSFTGTGVTFSSTHAVTEISSLGLWNISSAGTEAVSSFLLPVVQGEEYWLSAVVQNTDTDVTLVARVYSTPDGTGSPTDHTIDTKTAGAGFDTISGSLGIVGGKSLKLVVQRTAGGASTAQFGDVSIRRRNKADLIVDGAINAIHIAADSIGASKWTTNVESDNYDEDYDGNPIAGWQFNKTLGQIKAVDGIFGGGTSALRPWVDAHPAQRNDIRAEPEYYTPKITGWQLGINTSTDFANKLAFHRFVDHVVWAQFLGEINNTNVDAPAKHYPVNKGEFWPYRMSLAGGSNKAWEVEQNGKLYYRTRNATTGVLGTNTQLARIIYDFELDPNGWSQSALGTDKIVHYAEWGWRPIAFKVPTGKAFLRAKLWGAGAGMWTMDTATASGPGGFAQADIPVTPGEMLIIVLGEPGAGRDAGRTQGFGGAGIPQSHPQAGGLTGIFRGSVARENALLIAGGGGAGRVNTCAGSPGGHPDWAGGNTGEMRGLDALEGGARCSACGGGYEGGINLAVAKSSDFGGRGGTNYSHPDNVNVTLDWSTNVDADGYATDAEPPQTADADYVAFTEYWMLKPPGWGANNDSATAGSVNGLCGGSGLAVLEWIDAEEDFVGFGAGFQDDGFQ